MNAITDIQRAPAGVYDYAGLDLTPVGPVLGAEIGGVDLDRPLDGETVAAIHAALLQYKVLIFRGQDLSHRAHIALGRCFGELEGHPVLPHVPGYPEILEIESLDGVKFTAETIPAARGEDKWHADVTFRERPSMGGILRARVLPPSGGDTLFADMAALYRDLPADLKTRLCHLRAEHDILHSFGGRLSPERREALRRTDPPQIHPVIRTHPETGEKALYVNSAFTTRILGLKETEGRALLRFLLDRVKAPEYQIRVRWSPGAVVFWDNRNTQHYPVLDYWPHQRVVERVTIRGDKPF